MEEYDQEIKYIPGDKNPVDGLTRRNAPPIDLEVDLITEELSLEEINKKTHEAQFAQHKKKLENSDNQTLQKTYELLMKFFTLGNRFIFLFLFNQ